MERLILARHGESDYSARGLLNGDPRHRCPLTATGREQAKRLGKLLEAETIDLCVTSEFERTRETAQFAFADRPIPMLVMPELNDHAAGEFEGRALVDYLAWAHAAPSAEQVPGEAESRADALRRFAAGYRLLLERPEPTIAAVIHSLPISYLVSGPLQRLPLVDYAAPTTLAARDVRVAVEQLEQWAESPTW